MTTVSIPLQDGTQLSGLVDEAPDARAWYVLAHGAGAGMYHPFMAAVARGLAARGISVLRFQFASIEAGSRRPDRPEIAHAAVRAAVASATALAPGLPLFAGGKSFGGRMTSQAQASEPLPGLCGLAFLGFPLHPAGKPSVGRAVHLNEVQIPMLFIQGTRDALADMGLLAGVLTDLPGASLAVIPEADHSFTVPARTGRASGEVIEEACELVAGWIRRVLDPS